MTIVIRDIYDLQIIGVMLLCLLILFLWIWRSHVKGNKKLSNKYAHKSISDKIDIYSVLNKSNPGLFTDFDTKLFLDSIMTTGLRPGRDKAKNILIDKLDGVDFFTMANKVDNKYSFVYKFRVHLRRIKAILKIIGIFVIIDILVQFFA